MIPSYEMIESLLFSLLTVEIRLDGNDLKCFVIKKKLLYEGHQSSLKL